MPKITVVPTQKVVKMSAERGIKPEKYLGGIQKTLIPNDLRYKDKKGQFLQDLKITRNDGSSFSIHEIESECDNLPKYIISDYGKNGTKRFYAYSHGIDLVRLQNDEKYLYAVSEVLCAKDRIEEKRQVSLKNNNTDYIYLGGLKYDKDIKRYVKIAKKYKDIEDEISSKKCIKVEVNTNFNNNFNNDLNNSNDFSKNISDKIEKNVLLGNITEHLVSMSKDDLEKIATTLGLK